MKATAQSKLQKKRKGVYLVSGDNPWRLKRVHFSSKSRISTEIRIGFDVLLWKSENFMWNS